MDISVFTGTKTLVFSIFSLREIWKTLCIKGPGCARALWFPPFAACSFLSVGRNGGFSTVCCIVDITDDDLVKFSKENENKNTAKKTEYDVRIFREYLDTIQERRDITQMPFPDLQKILMKFILAVSLANLIVVCLFLSL